MTQYKVILLFAASLVLCRCGDDPAYQINFLLIDKALDGLAKQYNLHPLPQTYQDITAGSLVSVNFPHFTDASGDTYARPAIETQLNMSKFMAQFLSHNPSNSGVASMVSAYTTDAISAREVADQSVNFTTDDLTKLAAGASFEGIKGAIDFMHSNNLDIQMTFNAHVQYINDDSTANGLVRSASTQNMSYAAPFAFSSKNAGDIETSRGILFDKFTDSYGDKSIFYVTAIGYADNISLSFVKSGVTKAKVSAEVAGPLASVAKALSSVLPNLSFEARSSKGVSQQTTVDRLYWGLAGYKLTGPKNDEQLDKSENFDYDPSIQKVEKSR